MEKKEGKIPVNARVDINYSNGKPKIKFGYTSRNPRKDAIEQNFYGYTCMIIIMIFVLIPAVTYDDYIFEGNYPEFCNVTLDDYHSNSSSFITKYANGNWSNSTFNYTYDAIYGANFICDKYNYSVSFRPNSGWRSKIIEKQGGFWNNDATSTTKQALIFPAVIMISFALAILLNIFATKWIVRQKWYQKWLPKHMAGNPNRKKKYYKFKPDDVIDNVIIVPNFKNIELIYKTDGEFSKYLKSVKIREHRHRVYKKQKVGKLKVNNYRWYAIFSFIKKPKNGFLEVIYQ